MSKPKKGDRLTYVGPYEAEVSHRYPPGTVVRFHTNRFHGPSVTVLLDKAEGETEDAYADWPISETAKEIQ